MGDNLPPTSPWVFQSGDYLGNVIRIQIPFDESTTGPTAHLINGPASVHKDPECLWNNILIGPPAGIHITIAVPNGDNSYTLAQVNGVGLTTYEQLNSLNITASATDH